MRPDRVATDPFGELRDRARMCPAYQDPGAVGPAGLEEDAEPKIVDALLALLEQVSDKPRRSITETHGPYSNAVLASKPLAYWRMGEMAGPTARDASGNDRHGVYEVALYDRVLTPDEVARHYGRVGHRNALADRFSGRQTIIVEQASCLFSPVTAWKPAFWSHRLEACATGFEDNPGWLCRGPPCKISEINLTYRTYR